MIRGKGSKIASQIILSLIILLILNLPAYSTDLYLLKIDSKESLETASGIINSARGIFDGKFLVELDSAQILRLRATSIEIEPVLTNFVPDRIFRVARKQPDLSQKALSFTPFYSSGENFLAELSKEDALRLKKEGYSLVPLEGRKTPLFYLPVTMPFAQRDDFPYDSLAERIRQDSIYAYNLRLEQFRTRYVYTDSIIAARDWLVNKFRSFGYTDVYYDTLYYYGYPLHNVVCRKTGVSEPGTTVVVGGHYDSWNQDS